MKAELYWIPGPWQGRLAIAARPRGGDWLEDEVSSWRREGIDVVVSLLTADEEADLELASEGPFCEARGMEYLSFPITDRSVPALRPVTVEFVQKLVNKLMTGKNVAVNCRQGIGRSALIVACALVLAGIDPETAFAQVSSARGCVVPETAEQRRWVIEFARTSPAPLAK